MKIFSISFLTAGAAIAIQYCKSKYLLVEVNDGEEDGIISNFLHITQFYIIS